MIGIGRGVDGGGAGNGTKTTEERGGSNWEMEASVLRVEWSVNEGEGERSGRKKESTRER